MALAKNLTEKQYFILACLSNSIQDFYKEYVSLSKGSLQLFDCLSNEELSHKSWSPSNICCESGEMLTMENIDVKVGYWTPFLWKPIRKDLKKQAMKFEALECQKIDCSCNDCGHLNRSASWCNKLNKETKIHSNLCHPQNQECFKHIRDF